MKSQNRSKIMMFFSGIAAKYEENPEYFIGASVEFVSGGKNTAEPYAKAAPVLNILFSAAGFSNPRNLCLTPYAKIC